MLLASRSRPYVCWRCLSQQSRASAALPRLQHCRLNNGPAAGVDTNPEHESGPLRHYNASEAANPSLEALTTGKPQTKAKLSIRDELIAWAASDAAPLITTRPRDVALSSKVNNSLTRPQGQVFALDEDGGDADLGEAFGGDHDEIFSNTGTSDRKVGDLVELAISAHRGGTLAIYLGYFSGRHHFYSHDSRWLMSSGYPAVFSVAQFAVDEELKLVLGAIPTGQSVEAYQHLQKQNQGPSRHDGAILLKKMHDFRLESERIHQNNIKSLDAARDHLAHETEIKHMSLFEITDVLLPQARHSDGTFPASALYSVLAVLRREDIAFRALSPSRDCHRQDYMFEVIPKAHVESIKRAVAIVRDYNVLTAKTDGVLTERHSSCAIGVFVQRARSVVAQSRAVRAWTPYGTLGPTEGFNIESPEWKGASTDIVNFLQWWASYDLFTTSSRYHSYGSTILRAVGLYEDALLDQRTAWTFLQELGVLDSREIPSRHRIRLPGTTFVKGGGLTRTALTMEAITESTQVDMAAAIRSETPSETVFCIDDPSTVVIDDGISLERTGRADEFWIHVHVADPASRIPAKSDLGNYMELIPENIYLPGHFSAMLPAKLGDDTEETTNGNILEELSLQSGSSALTFSAKVNSAGDILDYGIKPTKLNNVAYLDPSDVSKFCQEPRSQSVVPDTKLSVGGPFEPQTYGKPRSMATTEELDQPVQEDLRTLYKLAEALRAKRLANGAWPIFSARPSVSVTHGPINESAPTPSAFPEGLATQIIQVPADPQIEVRYDSSQGCSVVSNTMVLAGEIAARWCSERGIPFPFRRDAASAQSRELALAYVNSEVYPLIKKGVEPSREHRGVLSTLIGGVEVSATPGPYFILGLDMYAKVTSPLRRFGDILAHWQIHAALAHEHKTGRKLDPVSDKATLDSILPFPETDLKQKLVLLQMREKMIRAISQGSRDWILTALVRGWRADDGSVPSTMRFTVSSRGSSGLIGELDYFKLPASLDAVEIDGKVLIQDVSVGDQLEVKLHDVNVYDGTIAVKAVSYLGRTEASPPSLIPAGARARGFGLGGGHGEQQQPSPVMA